VVATTMPTRTPLKPRPTDAGVLRSRGQVAQTEPGLLRTSLALEGVLVDESPSASRSAPSSCEGSAAPFARSACHT
jgi:hypothetical protein